jgi:Na+/melibiose symporter-like transporter
MMNKLKKGREPLYALAGLGPNLMNLLLSVYIVNAFSVAGFDQHLAQWTFFEKTIVIVGLFSVLITIGKIVDGIIDIPLAALSDKIVSKFGKRKTGIVLGLAPLILCYVLFLFPLQNAEDSLANTLYAGALFLVFCVSYTMTLLNYYATFTSVTSDTRQRAKLSSFKAFYDTISYSLVYALIPLIVGFGLHIRDIALYSLPLVLTMLIPLFAVKEDSSLADDQSPEEQAQRKVGLFQKLKITLTNVSFVKWIGVYAVFFFGLQIFLSGQNVLASGAMGFNGWQTALMNTGAFAPIPLTLFIYYKVMKKWGFTRAFQTAILSFILAMSAFALAYVDYVPSLWARFGIALAGSTIGSYGIGAFFMAPYFIVSSIAQKDKEKTKVDNTAMYFAVQGLFVALAGAVAIGLVWLNIKEISTADQPYLGPHLMTFAVIGICLVSFVLSFFLKDFVHKEELGGQKDR